MLRLQSTISSWREYLSPVSHVSTFKQTGEITPEEFVLAGDYLVYKFPTWSWSSAPASKMRDFLPPDKQFLVTKHVASHVRAQTAAGEYASGTSGVGETEDEDGWTISYGSGSATASVSGAASSVVGAAVGTDKTTLEEGGGDEDDADSILDIDEMEDEDPGYFDGNSATAATTAAATTSTAAEGSSTTTTLPDRSYNLYITYSTSYRVPKMYLSGFNSSGSPLSPQEMFEDIVSEYKDKTVTIETSPFLENTTMVSIHPCRHASVMKMLLSRAEARQRRIRKAAAAASSGSSAPEDLMAGIQGLGLDSEEWEDIATEQQKIESGEKEEEAVRVDQYLVIFLKFISSVTPGIEHDNTMAAL
ncbi:autophagy-related E2-like conjugation enzyme ATG3 [Myxozyma melibiosi]|uniref:Autophagy-related protein 3 n=1 Tax=Myxozyma melibiosi TaxID=54550 RepID=A0ABR1FCA6_9ASCO